MRQARRHQRKPFFLGDALVLTSLLPEAMYYILSKMHVNSLPVFLISSLLNGINAILLLFCLSFSTWDSFTIHTLDWLILIILGLSSGLFMFLVFRLPDS